MIFLIQTLSNLSLSNQGNAEFINLIFNCLISYNFEMDGRLKKGAGTHLASWLQEVDNVSLQQAQEWLLSPSHPKTNDAVAKIK